MSTDAGSTPGSGEDARAETATLGFKLRAGRACYSGLAPQ